MFFIMGISDGMQQIDFLKTKICNRCGSFGRVEIFMTYSFFSFFFIPLLKWNKKHFVRMHCCGAMYSLDSNVAQAISRGEAVELRETDLHYQGCERSIYLSECPYCKVSIESSFGFCPHCGKKLK